MAQTAEAPSTTTTPTTTATKTTVASTIVLLLCGLPASGKSSLATAFLARNNSNNTSGAVVEEDEYGSCDEIMVHIEYDHLQAALLQRVQQPQPLQQGAIQDDADFLQAWRQSRIVALDKLRENLQQQEQVGGCCTKVILMDDNFYLKSMRKQVYQICRQHQQTAASGSSSSSSSAASFCNVYFGVVWLDTAVDVCTKRNRRRTNSSNSSNNSRQAVVVPDEIIRRMSQRFDAPGLFFPSWEDQVAVLHLDGSDNNNLQANVVRLRDFVRHLPTLSNPVPPPPLDPTRHQEQLRAAQVQTQESVRHTADQFWRQCVARTVQHNRSLATMANRVRKHCLKQLHQLQLQQASSISEDSGVNTQRSWLDMFLQGLPGDRLTQWLTIDEKKALQRDLCDFASVKGCIESME